MYIYTHTLTLQNNFTLMQLHPVHIASFTSAGLNISSQMAMNTFQTKSTEITVTVKEVELLIKHMQRPQTYQISLCTLSTFFISHRHSRPNQNTKPFKFLSAALNNSNE